VQCVSNRWKDGGYKDGDLPPTLDQAQSTMTHADTMTTHGEIAPQPQALTERISSGSRAESIAMVTIIAHTTIWLQPKRQHQPKDRQTRSSLYAAWLPIQNLVRYFPVLYFPPLYFDGPAFSTPNFSVDLILLQRDMSVTLATKPKCNLMEIIFHTMLIRQQSMRCIRKGHASQQHLSVWRVGGFGHISKFQDKL